MVGSISVVGLSMTDWHACPCLCLDALPSSNLSSGDLIMHRSSINKSNMPRLGSLKLSSPFLDSVRALSCNKILKRQRKNRRFMIVNEVAGQYEDSFEDVKATILNYFTYKAVRTVLNQLYEMNPPQYRWFYEVFRHYVRAVFSDRKRFKKFDLSPEKEKYVATNKPNDGKHFIRGLAKERNELAERVMITRLHLYGKWIKKCDHAAIYKEISDQNLELLRERLMETVIWPSDDTNTEKIG